MGIYYTNQTIEAYRELEKNGYLKGDKKFIYLDFLPSYQWMVEQMDKRINNNGSFPIWLWKEKPDLNEEGHFPKGTKSVCLTVEIPDDNVLLSDFDTWHYILNTWFLPLSEEEDDLFEAGKLNISMEQSWERIFDFELLRKSEIWSEYPLDIQGVTPIIRKEQIIDIEHFIAK
ncbi:DUF3841 domain-containing protein [Bacillus thuringiensis]|uniref:DUF3841 domain-containing protein n=1 Tax=Bacillus thuringiensis TaxID=1428 RepID=A0A9X6WJ54_BACTU|nr:DUF3841 domain-containing protein [Bacillus thuringiensis]PFJ33196.1 hypothetical protein COJ15_28555 [Bacillus thuringiensis]